MQTATQNIIKILPKGLITIPKKWREDLGFEENGLARVRKEGKRLILEPVILDWKEKYVREFSNEEIQQWLNDDKLDKKTLQKIKTYLG